MTAINHESVRHSWEVTKTIQGEGYTTPLPVQWVCRRCGLGKRRGLGWRVTYSHGQYGAGPCEGASDAF